ncbi:uncharacterized protein METZ01_LOCUS211530 [marine metagenome]|uniref:Uncharacterized protein n=1 Tax=marine metagenome TaxID=408172 RepID=A0A382F6K8_9ZZZZ
MSGMENASTSSRGFLLREGSPPTQSIESEQRIWLYQRHCCPLELGGYTLEVD